MRRSPCSPRTTCNLINAYRVLRQLLTIWFIQFNIILIKQFPQHFASNQMQGKWMEKQKYTPYIAIIHTLHSLACVFFSQCVQRAFVFCILFFYSISNFNDVVWTFSVFVLRSDLINNWIQMDVVSALLPERKPFVMYSRVSESLQMVSKHHHDRTRTTFNSCNSPL